MFGGWAMSVRFRVPVLICAASAAALLLGGCASSGVVASLAPAGGSVSSAPSSASDPASDSSSSPVPAAATTTTTTDSPAPDPITTTTDSSIGVIVPGKYSPDAGCNEAMTAVFSAASLQSSGDPSKELSGLTTIIAELKDAAKITKRHGAATAINNISADLHTALTDGMQGKQIDNTKLMNDGNALAAACVG